MTERKFYRTVIEVVVLSQEPYDPVDLSTIHWDIVDGDCSGQWGIKNTKELNGKQAAKALHQQGSDPSFFRLDEKGNDYD
jgi:hypothetical protein